MSSRRPAGPRSAEAQSKNPERSKSARAPTQSTIESSAKLKLTSVCGATSKATPTTRMPTQDAMLTQPANIEEGRLNARDCITWPRQYALDIFTDEMFITMATVSSAIAHEIIPTCVSRTNIASQMLLRAQPRFHRTARLRTASALYWPSVPSTLYKTPSPCVRKMIAQIEKVMPVRKSETMMTEPRNDEISIYMVPRASRFQNEGHKLEKNKRPCAYCLWESSAPRSMAAYRQV